VCVCVCGGGGGGGGIGTHILFLVNIIVVNISTRVGKGYRVLEWDTIENR